MDLKKTRLTWQMVVIGAFLGAAAGFCGQFIFDFVSWQQCYYVGCVSRYMTMAEYMLTGFIDRNAGFCPPVLDSEETQQKKYVLRRELYFLIWMLKRYDVIQRSMLVSTTLGCAVPFIMVKRQRQARKDT
ncbi:MAG TPA: hypothetical protein V6C97_31825 [Oculatellaceae cyanobacterium]